MPWSEAQRSRLAIEKGILSEYFADKVTWIDPTESSKTRVELKVKSNSDKDYKLRVYLHEDFPNSCPHMAIVSPPKLLTKNKRQVPLLDQHFHTLGMTVDGFTKLCHFSPELWTADNTLFKVLIKGIMWIEAYEGHLQTGNSMDFYLGEQERTQSENKSSEDTNVDIEGTLEEEPVKSACCVS